MEVSKPKRLYLLTYPRTASNLMQKILALDKQPNLAARATGGYFFLPALMKSSEMGVRGQNIDTWTPEQTAELLQVYRDCVEDMVQYVDEADAQGKTLFVKEHAAFLVEPTEICNYLFGAENVKERPWVFPLPGHPELKRSPNNITMLPDEYLKTFSPTFLIRHPALAFPSHYRAFLDIKGKEVVEKETTDFAITMTLRWTRQLYEWWSNELSDEQKRTSDPEVTWPVIIDADDVMSEPDVLNRLCTISGLSHEALRFEWEKDSGVQGHTINQGMAARMLSTITSSTGIKKGLTSEGIDIDTEVPKWTEEFGETGAQMLEKYVRESMPDYEYLKGRRMRALAADA